MDSLLGILMWGFVFGVVGGVIGARKNRGLFGFLVSFLTGPAGILLVWAFPATGMRSCAHCGKLNFERTTWCRYCGDPLGPVERAAAAPAKPGSWKSWLLAIGAVAIVVGVIYTLMSSRIAMQESECRERCVAAGYRSYQYTPPQGVGARAELARCGCVK